MPKSYKLKNNCFIDATGVSFNRHKLSDVLYPVGSIYMSVNSTSPASIFGGTWVQIKDKFLLACGETYSNGDTGGSTKHSHKYGFQYGSSYCDVMLEGNTHAGLVNYSQNNTTSVTGGGTMTSKEYSKVNNGSAYSTKEILACHFRMTAQNEYVSTLPPYLAVYVWYRTE